MTTPSTSIPIACDLTVFSTAEQDQAANILTEVKSAVIKAESLANGLKLTFEANSHNVMLLAQFIDHERQCCAFLDFSLEVRSGSDVIALQLTGPHGTNEFLQAMAFPLPS